MSDEDKTIAKQKAEIDRLNGVLGGVKEWADRLGPVPDGYFHFLQNGEPEELQSILSSTPEVLAVMEGYISNSDDTDPPWMTHESLQQSLDVWKTRDSDEDIPVTIHAYRRDEG